MCLYGLPHISAGGLVVECSLTMRKVMGSIPDGVIQHLRVGSRVSGVKTRDESRTHPYRKVVAKEKGAFGLSSTWRSTNLLLLIVQVNLGNLMVRQ